MFNSTFLHCVHLISSLIYQLFQSTKAAPMTRDQTMILVQLVAASKIINCKATNATNNKLKEQAWQDLTNEYNSSVTSFPRTPSQLRLKWENLKKSARKRCATMRSRCNKIFKNWFVTILLPNPCECISNGMDKNIGWPSLIFLFFFTAKRKHKLEEEKCKARINRDNALAEYLIVKKKKVELELEEKEIIIAKLKVELENAKLENLKLKNDLNK
ncbi:uncharacterized protein LOC135193795 [Vanessa tameamea]|uniref:Regulatory protein zeste n=1 Tax=Vanessa tameamea TaxID=334116 RepID=A0ABM4ARD2_VANTA